MAVICRNCGAVIEADNMKICPYCDTDIIKEEYSRETVEAMSRLINVLKQILITKTEASKKTAENFIWEERKMAIKCRNCGAAISDGVTICPYCDTEITFETRVGTSEVAPHDTSGISFTLTFSGQDDEPVAVNDVQTIKNYAERMGNGQVLDLEASSPIYGITYLSGAKEVYFKYILTKNNISYLNSNLTLEEFLKDFIDFYEGRFNPNLDEYELIEQGKPAGANTPAAKLFQINTKAFTEQREYETSEQKAFEAIKIMCDYVNNPYAGATDSDQRPIYLRFFDKMAETDTNRATLYVKNDLLKKAYALISNRLTADENPVYWMDDAAFKTGKKGVMLTDKRLFFVKKKEILELPLKDIKSIYLKKNYSSFWFFNCNKNYELYTHTYSEAGAFFAYICSMARDLNGAGYKIQINCEK